MTWSDCPNYQNYQTSPAAAEEGLQTEREKKSGKLEKERREGGRERGHNEKKKEKA